MIDRSHARATDDLPVTRYVPLTQVFSNKHAAVKVTKLQVGDEIGVMFCIEFMATVGTRGGDERLIELYVDPEQFAAITEGDVHGN